MPVTARDHDRLRRLLEAARADWKGELPERDRRRIVKALELAAEKLPAPNRGKGRRKEAVSGNLLAALQLLKETGLIHPDDDALRERLEVLADSRTAHQRKGRPGSNDDPGR